jgi:UDP-glucuronate 4-epimerase
MNVLVTGGAGFIGSHVMERLTSGGHSVTCLDNFDEFYDPRVKRSNIASMVSSGDVRLVEGDIRDTAALERCFSGDSIDAVVHLAARAGVRPSLLQPELYYDVNVTGTLRLLEAMRRHGVRKMLFASSSSVYGNNRKTPFSETDIVDNPVSPYAASKKAGELLCHTYSHLYGFDIFCLRFFTVYGPRQRPEMAIHQFARNIIAGHPVTLYGDGTTRRDYTYIDDILDGITKSLENVRGYEVLNLGESRTVELRSLVSTLEAALNRKADIRWEPMQPGDVEITYADIDKARRLVGYAPRWPLEAGIRSFVDWLTR